MKRIIVISVVLTCFVFFSCTSMGGFNAGTSDKKLQITEKVFVNFESIKYGLKRIKSSGEIYSPSDNSMRICKIDLTIINNSEIDYKYSNFDSLELLMINNEGEAKFYQWTKPFDFGNINSIQEDKQKIIEKNTQQTDRIYFIYDKGYAPAVIMNNRINSIMVINEDDPKYNTAQDELNKSITINASLKLVEKGETYDKLIQKYREIGLKIDAVNNRGINLLIQAIISYNNSVVEGAISDGADLHHRVELSYSVVEPMHIAVLSRNKFAVEKLINAGVSLEYSTDKFDDPAVLAIRMNNLPAVMMLHEMGVSVADKMIPMAWGNKITGINFAKDRDHNEMAVFLESIK